MIFNKTAQNLFLCLSVIFSISAIAKDEYQRPRLVVTIVVDGLSYEILQKHVKDFKGAFREFHDHAIVYTNAYWPHAPAATAVGHAALNTGVFAQDHGIIGNSWINLAGDKVAVDDTDDKSARVISPDGLYDYSRSPHNLMVDGISDQLMLQSEESSPCKVFSISGKSRAAILTAGSCGKAIWVDTKAGCLTSSNFYYQELPMWVKCYNKKHPLNGTRTFRWDLRFDTCEPYDYEFSSYEYSTLPETMIGREISIDHAKNGDEPYEVFLRMPQSNKYLLDAAVACVRANLSRCKSDRMLLWVCLSPLDKIAHLVGPNSKEYTDMVYHLDRQIKLFMRDIRKLCRRNDTVYVITADHGMSPMPEWLNDHGYEKARRIMASDTEDLMNKYLKDQGLPCKSIIKDFSVYFVDGYEQLSPEQQNVLLESVKKLLLAQPGIHRVWTNAELDALVVNEWFAPHYFKTERYPGRSGHLFIQVEPFCQLSKRPTGTSHEAPYEWNTHVPLMIYRNDWLEKKIVTPRVSMLQLPNTLSAILRCPKPSASVQPLLPGIFPKQESYI